MINKNIDFLLNISKFVLTSLLSAIIISILLSFYNLTPVHIDNSKGNTDYIWPANAAWMKMTEGISWGKFDSNGYNNLKVIEKPDIILLGSSHMEATNIRQNETIASLLNKQFDKKYSVYNLGISGHDFYKTCQYLPINLQLYNPKVVIIETSKVSISSKNVDDIITHAIKKTPSYSSGILYFLQRIAFFRIMNFQIEGGLLKLLSPPLKTNNKLVINNKSTKSIDIDVSAYEKLFQHLESIQKENGVQIVIFYHPAESLENKGDISFYHGKDLEEFASTAAQNDIVFIDMTEPFKRMYNEKHHVPHGFSTGKLCAGHLNAYGHKAVAEELAPRLEEMLKERKP